MSEACTCTCTYITSGVKEGNVIYSRSICIYMYNYNYITRGVEEGSTIYSRSTYMYINMYNYTYITRGVKKCYLQQIYMYIIIMYKLYCVCTIYSVLLRSVASKVTLLGYV